MPLCLIFSQTTFSDELNIDLAKLGSTYKKIRIPFLGKLLCKNFEINKHEHPCN